MNTLAGITEITADGEAVAEGNGEVIQIVNDS